MGRNLMRLSEITFPGAQARPIDGYGPGFFRVGGDVTKGATFVLPSRVTDWNGFDDPKPLLDAAGQMDVMLIGTGAEMARIPTSFRQALENAGIAFEPMPTPSACRTYNVLLAEGRRVGAALLPV